MHLRHHSRPFLRKLRFLAPPALGGVLGLLTSCDGSQLPARPSAGPELRQVISEPTSIGSTLLRPPASSSPAEVGAITPTTFATVSDSTWVVISVEGAITMKENGECRFVPPSWPCQGGSPFTQFESDPGLMGPVAIYARQGVNNGRVPLRALGGGSSISSAIGLHFQATGGTLSGAIQMIPLWAWEPNHGDGVASYQLFGGYTVTATAIPNPLRLSEGAPDSSGTRTYSLEPLDGLELRNPLDLGVNWPEGAVFWYFFPGDSVGDQPGFTGTYEGIPECEFQTTCQYRSTQPGRVQAAAYVEGRYAAVRSLGGVQECLAPLGPLGSRSARFSMSGTAVRGCTTPPEPAALTCTAVARGETVTCTVTGDNVAVTRWRFDNGQDYIAKVSTDLVWTGTAVIGGNVYADFSLNGIAASEPLSTSMSVADRNWHWGPDQWGFSQGTAADCFSVPPTIGARGEWGWNVRKGSCDPGRISPSLRDPDHAGFKVAPVADGPNQGLWYVTEVTYRMDAETNINMQLTSAGNPFPVTDMSQGGPCRHKIGYSGPPPVPISFYDFNTACKARDLSAMFSGIWAHEGMGTRDGNGHEAQNRIAAGMPENDLYKVLERVYGPTEGDATAQVLGSAGDVDSRIQRYGGDHRRVNGNWCGSAWIFDPASGGFLFVPRVLTSEHRCI